MSQSTGTGTDFFSPLIIFGTDVLVLVLVLVLVQFSSTDSVLVLMAQVLSQSVPVPKQKNSKNQVNKLATMKFSKICQIFLFKFQFQTQKF
jgi:hypothetical protein